MGGMPAPPPGGTRSRQAAGGSAWPVLELPTPNLRRVMHYGSTEWLHAGLVTSAQADPAVTADTVMACPPAGASLAYGPSVGSCRVGPPGVRLL